MEHFVGGSLKLKGSSSSGSSDLKKKKKKKKDKEKLEKALNEESLKTEEKTSSSPVPVIPHGPRKTEAELKFEEAQRKRLEQKVDKIAATSHKERVAEFNKYLESLSEHYDMPRVGPG